VFNAAVALLIAIVKQPGYFAAVVVRGAYRPGSLSFAEYERFHRAWGEEFGGVSEDLLGFEPGLATPADASDTRHVLRLLNLLAWSGCIEMFSTGPDAVELLVLALLPWCWAVANRDLTRFLVDSPEAKCLMATHGALERLLAGRDLQGVYARLAFMTDGEGDIYDAVHEVCGVLVPRLSVPNLTLVVRFFTSCLRSRDRWLKLPLYLVVAWIGHFSSSPEVRQAMGPFSELFQRDKEDARKTFAGLSEFFGQIGTEVAVGADPPAFRAKLCERIVALNASHLHERTWSDVSFKTLDALPPLLPPARQEAADCRWAESMREMRACRFEPFATWNDLMDKMEIFLVDTAGEVEAVRGEVPMRQVLERALGGGGEGAPPEPPAPPPRAEDACSWGLALTDPASFLPDIDEANMVGDEIVNGEV
jgi:hypothetical protein